MLNNRLIVIDWLTNISLGVDDFHSDWYSDSELKGLAADALELLKAQEHEIGRLKHHVPCEEAELTGAGCLGYGKGPSDDEPIDACKNCRKYVSYGVE